MQLNAYMSFFQKTVTKSIVKGQIPFYAMFTNNKKIYIAYSPYPFVAGTEGVILVKSVSLKKCLESSSPAAIANRPMCRRMSAAADLDQVLSVVANVGLEGKAAIWKNNPEVLLSPEEQAVALGVYISAALASPAVMRWVGNKLVAQLASGAAATDSAGNVLEFTPRQIVEAIEDVPQVPAA
jgi:hypothetical protein